MKHIPLLPAVLLLTLSLFFSPTQTHCAMPPNPPLPVMIGQMILVGFRGNGTAPDAPGLSEVLKDVRHGRIGGVILFDRDWQTKKRGRNITSTAQVRDLTARLQKNAPIPLFIAVDQEGGRVRRLRESHGFAATPSALEMGAKTPEETREAARAMGRGLRRLGVNLNFAPVADIAVNPDSPAIGRIGRAFSADPDAAAKHAAAFAMGLADARVAGCYKHFPGHGSAGVDPHYEATNITATWSEAELLPYAPDRMPHGIPLMVMTGHLLHKGLDPHYPATLSRAVTTGLLREKLGWQGVVVTDDLEMGAVGAYSMEERILLAIRAGADIILFGNNIDYRPEQGRRIHALITRLVEKGDVSPERIAQSWIRIKALKEQLR